MVRLGFLAFVAVAAVAGVSAAAVVPNWPVQISFVGAPAEAPIAGLEAVHYVPEVRGPIATTHDEIAAGETAPTIENVIAADETTASIELAAADDAALVPPAPIPASTEATPAAEPVKPEPVAAEAPATEPVAPEPVAAEAPAAEPQPIIIAPFAEVRPIVIPPAPAASEAATTPAEVPSTPSEPATATAPDAPAAPETTTAAPEAAPAAEETVAAEPAPPARPEAIATEQDIAIRLQLRLLNADRVTGPISKEDRASVAQFYKSRGYKPAWVADGRLTDAARALAQRLMLADTDGLIRTDFPTPPLYLGEVAAADAGALADADLLLSESIATYVHEAQSGKVVPKSISADIEYQPVAPDALGALNYLLSAKDPVAAMVAYNPPQEGYLRLRAALAEARAAALVRVHTEIAAGPTLKPGMTDIRVGQLRKRLEIAAQPGTDPNTFDETLVEAVKAFQKSNDLKPDAMVGGNTLKKLNDAVADPTSVIISNMERWRWMPRDLGRFYVNVNIPQFEVILRRDGEIIHTTRVVVGKPANKTPIFGDEIEHVIVNPYWNVPSSITTKEMWPEIVSDPGSLTRQNYEVFARVDGRFREVDPLMVDWYSINPKQVQIRQRPGAGNALGTIKFMFPNSHDVYLHDTPSKSLFQRDYRAFSHGCVRVMNPMEFADALLTEEPDLSVAKIKKMIGGRETLLEMKRHVPVYLTYFNAWVDEDGKLQLRADVYGHDAKVRKALGL
jgi:murein L,D-transpeptidase YcbB/YkuD